MHKKNSWQYGELFHSELLTDLPWMKICSYIIVPREIDFSIHDRRNPDPYAEQTHDNGLDVHIRTVFCTDYISEHVDRPDEPTSTPKFSHCMNRPAPNGVMLDFECLLDAQELLKAITTRWTIRAVR